jgi:putrescine transport system substrate-binding protein
VRFLFHHAGLVLVAWIAAVTAAADDHIVNYYNWADYIAPSTLPDFERETGLKVNYDQYDSSFIVTTRLLAGSTGYDVVDHSAAAIRMLIPTGAFARLDKSKLPNWKNIDPAALALLAPFDPEHAYIVPYSYGSTGFAYNVDMVRERMPDAPLHSADMLFKPEVVSRFADCGISFLDSWSSVIGMALIYLGLPVNSHEPEDLAAVENLIRPVRPYIKYFSSTKMMLDLPNREVCIAMSWSGDYGQAASRAREAGIDIELAYTVPGEGAPFWFDGLVIPADAPHPDNAHRLLDYFLRPQVMATITNHIYYGNALLGSKALVAPGLADNPAIFAPPSVLSRLHPEFLEGPKITRRRARAWARIKAGL